MLAVHLWRAAGQFELGPFGYIGLDLQTIIGLPSLLVGTSGVATLSLTLPNDSRLTGLSFYWQAALLEAGGYYLSNVFEETVQ